MVFRLFAAFVIGGLLTGCLFTDVQKIKNDSRLLRDYLKAYPVPTHCSQPGRDQDIVCNYKLVIWHVDGEVYRGHVAPSLVEEGVKACNALRKEKDNDSDLYMVIEYSECPTVENYRYNVYEFKIAGPRIPDSKDVNDSIDLENVPHGSYMKKGHIDFASGSTQYPAR